jgi:hypothetical protein
MDRARSLHRGIGIRALGIPPNRKRIIEISCNDDGDARSSKPFACKLLDIRGGHDPQSRPERMAHASQMMLRGQHPVQSKRVHHGPWRAHVRWLSECDKTLVTDGMRIQIMLKTTRISIKPTP